MIVYDAGDYQLSFIWSLEGSTLPKAAMFGLPSAAMALVWKWLLNQHPTMLYPIVSVNVSVSWSMLTVVLGMLLAFRTNKAYARFWEGTTLIQEMRAEWFEACSNLMAFSKMSILKDPTNAEVRKKCVSFGFTLVRLVSLMHGAALRQVTGGDGEEFDVLDVRGLDDESLDYMQVECAFHDINRVEVLLHWVQVLITDSIHDGVLTTPPPILTRAYQTLSRGMVNLHNVRKLADVPFPFPLSQMLIVILLIQSLVTPVFVSQLNIGYIGTALLSFLPTFGMWSITFIAGELEQPFGRDPNDLPLCELQFEMNNSLLMLLDERAARPPGLKHDAIVDVEVLRSKLGDPDSTTDVIGNKAFDEEALAMKERVSCASLRRNKLTMKDARKRASSKVRSCQSELSRHHCLLEETKLAPAVDSKEKNDCKVDEVACNDQGPNLKLLRVGGNVLEEPEREQRTLHTSSASEIDVEIGWSTQVDSDWDHKRFEKNFDANDRPALIDPRVCIIADQHRDQSWFETGQQWPAPRVGKHGCTQKPTLSVRACVSDVPAVSCLEQKATTVGPNLAEITQAARDASLPEAVVPKTSVTDFMKQPAHCLGPDPAPKPPVATVMPVITGKSSSAHP